MAGNPPEDRAPRQTNAQGHQLLSPSSFPAHTYAPETIGTFHRIEKVSKKKPRVGEDILSLLGALGVYESRGRGDH